MKRRFLTILAIAIVLLGTPFAALAQSYSFSLDKEDVIVFLNEDSSIALEYTFVFTNDGGAHAIDFVDVGMPNDSFDMGSVSAQVNGKPVTVSTADYQGSGSGFAVVLGSESIQPYDSGTVQVSVGRITSVLNPDSQDAKYASFDFIPTWFGSEFVHGNTDLTVSFHLPPGVQTNEPRFHMLGEPWTGDKEPATDTDEKGRIVYTWHDEKANGYSPYLFGASLPVNYVPAYATQLAQPTLPPPTIPPVSDISQAIPQETGTGGLAGWIIVGGILVLVLGAASLRNRFSENDDERLDYSSPQVSIEGYGIKRGLTAVEAAVVLGQPLEKILTMILFGLVKKGAAKVVKRDPLQLDIAPHLPEDLYGYEKRFLYAFRLDNAKEREGMLQEMFVDLIKAVSEKLRGFSKDETQLYYRGMMQRAWQQVREANTPEVKNQEFDQSFDWLMLNYHFKEDVQELFQDAHMAAPQWWGAYDQGFRSSDRPLPLKQHDEERSSDASIFELGHSTSQPRPASPSAAREVKPTPSALPGADYAASIVNSVQDFSSRVITDMDKFTERVHKVTVDLQPVYSQWQAQRSKSPNDVRDGLDKSDGGFFRWLSSSSSSSHQSSSSSSHSHCACACAGCACACAGGGR